MIAVQGDADDAFGAGLGHAHLEGVVAARLDRVALGVCDADAHFQLVADIEFGEGAVPVIAVSVGVDFIVGGVEEHHVEVIVVIVMIVVVMIVMMVFVFALRGLAAGGWADREKQSQEKKRSEARKSVESVHGYPRRIRSVV